MPRWIWITLALAAAAVFWAGNRERGPVVAELAGAALACPQLEAPRGLAEPLQRPVGEPGEARVDEHLLRPLAAFAIEARVLGREDYRLDRGAALSPTDLALGWQRMADPAVYEKLDISQGGRWYRYRWGNEGPPIPAREIVRSSANMHLVPANAAVAHAISRVEPDQTVRLQGWLLEVEADDGWRWRSSLSREDSGDGACELIYVCEFEAW